MPAPQATSPTLPVACFAPDLTDAKLSEYKSLVYALPHGPLRDAVQQLLQPVLLWWDLPVSDSKDVSRFAVKHRGKDATFRVVPLTEDLKRKLHEAIPWPHELKAIQALLDAELEGAAKPLRDAAYHLLWFAWELCHDREPLTQASLPEG